MSIETETEPAFPLTWQYRYGDTCAHTGMTKLEYFAGLAMQGMLANGAAPLDTQNMSFAVACAKNLIAELEQST
jgi:hypothetical protein